MKWRTRIAVSGAAIAMWMQASHGVPAPSPRPRAAALPALARMYVGDAAGFPRRHFFTVEEAIYVYAWLKQPPPSTAASRSPTANSTAAAGSPAPTASPLHFRVSIRDPLGHEVASFDGAVNPRTRDDLPRACADDGPNGITLAGTSLADHPGHYRAQAFIDDRPVGNVYFDVTALKGAGDILMTSAAVEDAAGARKFTFRSNERGVYAHVTFVNKTRTRPHQHLVQVEFVGPDGRVGRPLGGVLNVEKGRHLDGRDFPTLIDPEHRDGLLIAGTPVEKMQGLWKVVVRVDGQVRRELPFRIVP